jgi:hypothetical protein
MLLALRARLRHGLTTLYFRDVVRPQILRTPPVTGIDDTCEIHVLTSTDDWLNLVWTLKSFYAVSPRPYALCIHEDGTLGDVALNALREHFPDARLIRRKEADAKMEAVLVNRPACRTFRRVNLLAPKVFDFIEFLEGERMAVFDSDLLFYRPPEAYLALLEDSGTRLNTFNEDIASAYAIDEASIRKAGHKILPRINSGLGVVHRDSMPLDWIEEFLNIYGLADGHFWRIEQTLFALCATRYGGALLPPEYRVYIGKGTGGRPMRHYVGAVRHLMYAEGMRFLAPKLLT